MQALVFPVPKPSLQPLKLYLNRIMMIDPVLTSDIDLLWGGHKIHEHLLSDPTPLAGKIITKKLAIMSIHIFC